jgi:release factor glutamine methyltransferase
MQRIPPLEARLLLEQTLRVNSVYLAAHPERALSEEETQRYRALVNRRVRSEPIAYIMGRREFYSLEFKVNPQVLIPRPETELLVDLALERIPEEAPFNVLDLGTGSGNIAIALAYHRPCTNIVAVDCSGGALKLARDNANNLLGSTGARRVSFVNSDWFTSIGDRKFDLIVSNPPYVAEQDPHLQQGDLRFEPQIALSAGRDGLDCIREIVAGAPKYINHRGWLLIEHGFDQGNCCRILFEKAGFSEVFCARDLAGLARVSGGRYVC